MTSREHLAFVLKNEHSTSLLKALDQDQEFRDNQLTQEIGGQVAKLDWFQVNHNWRVWLPLAWVKDWFSITEETRNVLNPVQVAILEAMALEIRNNPISLYHQPLFVNKILRADSRLVVMTALEELIGQLQFIAEVKETLDAHHQVVTNWWLSGQGDELSSSDAQFQEILVYFAKYASFLEAREEIAVRMRKAEAFMMEFIITARTAVDKKNDSSFQEALNVLETMKTELKALLTPPPQPGLSVATDDFTETALADAIGRLEEL